MQNVVPQITSHKVIFRQKIFLLHSLLELEPQEVTPRSADIYFSLAQKLWLQRLPVSDSLFFRHRNGPFPFFCAMLRTPLNFLWETSKNLQYFSWDALEFFEHKSSLKFSRCGRFYLTAHAQISNLDFRFENETVICTRLSQLHTELNVVKSVGRFCLFCLFFFGVLDLEIFILSGERKEKLKLWQDDRCLLGWVTKLLGWQN